MTELSSKGGDLTQLDYDLATNKAPRFFASGYGAGSFAGELVAFPTEGAIRWNSAVNTLPSSSLLRTVRGASCLSAIHLAMARPSPVPFTSPRDGSARTKRSKIRGRSVSGMPMPLVSDSEHGARRSHRQLHFDPPSSGRVLDGVIQENRDQAAKSRTVATDPCRRGAGARGHCLVFRLGQR